jgi:hypothetical protein
MIQAALPAGAPQFMVLSLRGDLMTDVVLTATGLLGSEDQTAAVVEGLKTRLAEATAAAEKERIALAVTYLKKIEIKGSGREVTASVKIEQKQVAGVVSAAMALIPMVAKERAEAAAGAARKAAEAAEAAQRGASRPAPSRPAGK